MRCAAPSRVFVPQCTPVCLPLRATLAPYGQAFDSACQNSQAPLSSLIGTRARGVAGTLLEQQSTANERAADTWHDYHATAWRPWDLALQNISPRRWLISLRERSPPALRSTQLPCSVSPSAARARASVPCTYLALVAECRGWSQLPQGSLSRPAGLPDAAAHAMPWPAKPRPARGFGSGSGSV